MINYWYYCYYIISEHNKFVHFSSLISLLVLLLPLILIDNDQLRITIIIIRIMYYY